MRSANRTFKVRMVCVGALVALAACSSAYPPRDTSTLDRINTQMAQISAQNAKSPAIPEAVSSSLLPPLKSVLPKTSSKQPEQRFDLVVTDAPINQVLMGIVHGTPLSIMVKPKTALSIAPTGATAVAAPPPPDLTERVTINLKNVTLFEALDSIREVYGYDYTLDGSRIYVQQPELQTRLYQVNYIVGQRRGVSDLQVIGGASVGGSSGSSSSSSTSSASSGAGSSSFSSVQASALSSIATSDIWAEVEDAVRTTLGCQIPRKTPRTSGATGSSSANSSNSNSGSAGRADVAFVGDTQMAERQRGVDGCTDGRAMAVSQMSGTVLVRGMPNEHRMINQILRSMQLNIERQVIIEAKIIDVELNAGAQQGINWTEFHNGLHKVSIGANTNAITLPGNGGGSVGTVGSTGGLTATTLGSALGTTFLGTSAGTAFSAGLGLAVQFRNFSAMINFLQTQGEVHVLSSPRIATMNSQKAVIKVGTEEPYVSSISPASNTTSGTSTVLTTSATLNYQPFFSGIALDVTPKIDDKGNITLHVHALVNSIVERAKIATPDANSVTVPFAVNTINEADSVVKAKDGQVVVIGGLMTESMTDNRSKLPGAGDVPGVGALFSKGGQKKIKRELVILLKPTVVADDSVWADDIAAVQGRLQGFNATSPEPKSQGR